MKSKQQDASVAEGYNHGYLDEQTKRMIRRGILKAVAIPGYQVPFAGREMPMPYGWGTGGIQLTASLIGQQDAAQQQARREERARQIASSRVDFFTLVRGE